MESILPKSYMNKELLRMFMYTKHYHIYLETASLNFHMKQQDYFSSQLTD